MPGIMQRFGDKFLDDIIYWIGNQLEPQEVFSNKKLSDWAEMNGYIKEE